MKRSYRQLCLLCSIVWVFSGCGKKGDPLTPIVPLPLPVSAVSARTTEDGIVLAWTPPITYDTEKTLELDDINYFSIYRKIEPPLDTVWNFDQSNEGWTATGQSLLPKQSHGVLRTASDQPLLTLLSPPDLGMNAEQNRFLRLKLWTKNAQQGYIAFITTADTRWDKDIDQQFEPSVHSSYFAVHQAFNSSKLKRFPIRQSTSAVAQEYVLDMHSIPAWEGTIRQIGLILQNASPKGELGELETGGERGELVTEGALGELETGGELVELGLDRVEFIRDIDAVASTYNRAPWLFLEDEEGWRSLSGETVSGAAQGILYAEGDGLISLLSAPGQRIHFSKTSRLQLRMRVTAGNEAYLLLRRGGEKPFRSEKELTDAVSRGIRIPLKSSSEFSTYTLDLQPYIEAFGPLGETTEETAYEEQPEMTQKIQTDETDEETILKGNDVPEQQEASLESVVPLQKQTYFAQIGIVFPAVAPGIGTRQISIDYIDILPESVDAELNVSRFAQHALPLGQEISREIHSRIQEKRTAFELSYEAIPGDQEQISVERMLLAEISPADPSPAKIVLRAPLLAEPSPIEPSAEDAAPEKTGRIGFELLDSGEFVVENEDGEDITATLEYGNRYTYEIEVTDRKKRTNEIAETISIEFMRAPAAPENVRAEGDDEKVTLSWDKPIVTEDGKKIKQLAGYRIFRSTSAGNYSVQPFSQVPASRTEFIDTDVTNRETYYYVVQALASQVPGTGHGKSSVEVSVMPLDISAPDAPSGLVGVYLHDKVNLHWNQVPTPDFSGFNIYRSNSRDGEFIQLNTELLRKASFTDETAEAKKRYYYYVTALDDEIPPNESEPSELEPIETYSLD